MYIYNIYTDSSEILNLIRSIQGEVVLKRNFNNVWLITQVDNIILY